MSDQELRSFSLFNELGGKFRVAVINACNLDCFFCHNEAMPNPRKGHAGPRDRRLDDRALLEIIDAFTALGGRQVNITGGEPLAHRDLPGFISRIKKRRAKVVLNTNAVLAQRLLGRPPIPALDSILASLHTTDDQHFAEKLGGQSAGRVMKNIAALKAHGYDVHINYSLGDYNKDEFGRVVDFALKHAIPLKAIAFVGSHEAPKDQGAWIDPEWLFEQLASRGAKTLEQKEAFGGLTTRYAIDGCSVKIKNIAKGRLMTDFCEGCAHQDRCGEGIYGLRVGVDGLWKPCLLRKDRFSAVSVELDYRAQILSAVNAMIGRWERARFIRGAPTKKAGLPVLN